MGDARSLAITDFLDEVSYNLRNTSEAQFTETELFVYYKRVVEILYGILIEEDSNLLTRGSGTISTVAGTETYDLSSNSMGDFWVPRKIWIAGSEPMKMCEEEDRWPYKMAEDDSNTGGRTEPNKFYLNGDYLGLLPFADAVYTVNVSYYPNYVPASATSAYLPFKNMFNAQIEECILMRAKRRNEAPILIETAMMEILQKRALELSRLRRKSELRMTPRVK